MYLIVKSRVQRVYIYTPIQFYMMPGDILYRILLLEIIPLLAFVDGRVTPIADRPTKLISHFEVFTEVTTNYQTKETIC